MFLLPIFFRNSHSQRFSVKSCSETFSKIHKKTSVQEFLSKLHANKNQLAVRLLSHILNGRKTCSEFFHINWHRLKNEIGRPLRDSSQSLRELIHKKNRSNLFQSLKAFIMFWDMTRGLDNVFYTSHRPWSQMNQNVFVIFRLKSHVFKKLMNLRINVITSKGKQNKLIFNSQNLQNKFSYVYIYVCI